MSASTVTTRNAATLHLSMFAAIQARDLEKLRGLYHDGYVYMSGDGREQAGADAGIAVVEMYVRAFPDLNLSIRNHYEPSDSVSVIEFTACGTHNGELDGIAATGKSVEVMVCNIVEAEEGAIYREREYYDTAALLRQLGVMES